MGYHKIKQLRTFALLLLILFTSYYSQSQINLDSLWTIWYDETVPDTNRTQALITFTWDGYLFSQPDSAFYFAQLLYDFADKKNLKKDMSMAKKIQGVSFFVKSNYPKALDYYQQSLSISEEISDRSGIASSLGNIGILYERKGNNLKALEYQQQCIKIKEEIIDSIGIAGALNNIGNIYKNLGDYHMALEYYNRFFILVEKMSHKSGMSTALNNIGLVYKNLGDYPSALDYYRRSLLINKETKDKRGIAHTLNNIGNLYKELEDYSKALEYYTKSLKVKEEISDKRGMVNTLNNIGTTYFMKGDFLNAISWCEKGFTISEEINILEGQKKSCQCLYDAYKAIGNDGKALHYHEQMSILNDSLQAEETAKKLQQMEFAKQMLADSLLQEEEKLKVQMAHEAQVRKKNRSRNIYFLIAFVFLVLTVGFYRRFLFTRKAKMAIENEKARSDKLLLNILPSEIAEELKEKGRAEPRKFELVSVLFTDFKGFTQLSEKLSAEKLVENINTCFKAFDAICVKHGIEKIKTIGDSYMAAGGLPVPTDDSVTKTVLAALEMVEFMERNKQEQEMESPICFEMRLGINTGPVVAGIVGVTKFQYDIWGDSVNTASRMENSGEVGKVNISRSTYDQIKENPAFRFLPRGDVMTKGKGAIEMWFVEKT